MKTGRKRWARWIVNHDQFALPDLKTMVVGCPSFSSFVLLSFWWYFGSKRFERANILVLVGVHLHAHWASVPGGRCCFGLVFTKL
jgi:hypothetical protein